jgi:hypothetical protein
MGLSGNKADVEFWREERLRLPAEYLAQDALVDTLAEALGRAETAGRALQESVEDLCVLLRASDGDLKRMNAVLERADKSLLGYVKAKRDEVKHLVDHHSPGRAYWPRLEAPFREFVAALAEDQGTDEEGQVVFGSRELPRWTRKVWRQAEKSFFEVTRRLDDSARSLRSAAWAGRRLRARLARSLNRFPNEEQDHE